MGLYIIYTIIFLISSFFIGRFFFALLLRGFLPFIPSRPWVVDEIMSELEIAVDEPMILAFSSGRSGLLHTLEKKFPKSELIGVEPSWFPFVVAKVQSWLRKTKIRVIRQPIHRVNVKQADFIYSHLYPDDMCGLGKKLKFECRPETIVVSTGFNLPVLIPKKTIGLPDRRGRLDWLSRNHKLFQRKSKKYKKENKAFFYEI